MYSFQGAYYFVVSFTTLLLLTPLYTNPAPLSTEPNTTPGRQPVMKTLMLPLLIVIATVTATADPIGYPNRHRRPALAPSYTFRAPSGTLTYQGPGTFQMYGYNANAPQPYRGPGTFQMYGYKAQAPQRDAQLSGFRLRWPTPVTFWFTRPRTPPHAPSPTH